MRYGIEFFGMHVIWWFFWIILWVGFFSFLTPVRRRHMRNFHQTPKDILQRRLASGEITEQEYESRMNILNQEFKPAGTEGQGLGRPKLSSKI